VKLRSVNVGAREASTAKRVGVTGHHEVPVESAALRSPGPEHGGLGSGLVGDFIGDVASHGGDEQAVHAFAREELDRWAGRLGRELPDGVFGENLTAEVGRTGAYLAIVTGGTLRPGDEITVVAEAGPEVPQLPEVFRRLMGLG